MIENQIININNLKVIGLYYSKEEYDYSLAEEFLNKEQIEYISLQKITEEISEKDLYNTNNCTKIFTELFRKSNGIIFLGGPDLPPSMYNEETELLTAITDPYRHYFEASFIFHLLGGNQNPQFKALLDEKPDYTVYGICLGMQTMNVATGGTMIQDIPSELYSLNKVEKVLQQDNNSRHRNYYNNIVVDSELYPGHFHEIIISDSKPFIGNEKLKTPTLVYSNHHQAIETIGKDFFILATSIDKKVVEAIGHKKYPNVLGIQFHPEGTYLHNSEVKFKVSPNDSLISGLSVLKSHNSYDFHLAYWKEFSRKMSLINSNKK